MTAVAFNLEAVQDALNEAGIQARIAAKEALAKYGDRDACGFAWVDVYGVRSNSKLGKALASYGFSKSYKGSLQLWNPQQGGLPELEHPGSRCIRLRRSSQAEVGLGEGLRWLAHGLK